MSKEAKEAKQKQYIAIDLKSFYASVESRELGYDPLDVCLLVADSSRTEKTICLAVSPALKSFGIAGRARLFEAVSRVKQVNRERLKNAPGHKFTGGSTSLKELKEHPEYSLEFVTATPRMELYMQYSSRIFDIYLNYIAPEDIHVYSVDEVFMDVTDYLKIYDMSPRELAIKMIRHVLKETGITATVGIGTNLYLSKIAMDIVAKHMPPDEDGVRLAELDEISFRKELWAHRPLTDFWRIGRGYASKLEKNGLYTMGDVARCSIGTERDYYNAELLYKLFGINAELLIDHAWGYEPCEIKDIKAYRPENNSISTGQVLSEPYTIEQGKLIVREMTDNLILDLVEKKLVTDQIVLTVGYDKECMENPEIKEKYKGPVEYDHYGRLIPKSAHGSINLGEFTSSTRLITDKTMELYDSIMQPGLLVRRMYVVANHVIYEEDAEKQKSKEEEYVQLDLFTDYEALEREQKEEELKKHKEKDLQEAVLSIKKKYGKNAMLKGMNLLDHATMRDRNKQVGGHKA